MDKVEHVKVWTENREIPTYKTGKPEKNPMFLEKRVYQGSSGKVYPYPVIDKIEDEKELKMYQLVILENEYIRIELMPEIGGRIYRALDKTNDYDFVYYNRVIKPALVGLAGPWISGGIEFNWPQHHRPNTFGPVDYQMSENEDGSATVWMSEIDRMYGTKMTAGFTLHRDKAYLQIDVQLYNRTSMPQTFLWWANPAVAVNDHTQSVFPPDVNAVFDHGKRDVSRFPIATGEYYKMDYSAGVDISKYKNIPVPTSYMAYKSEYDFVGGYDHQVRGGLLHVANHYLSPGKKQWTWGNGEFGQAWDRQLTDEDGPYIELMTGVFTDNQPDFTWLHPYETKTFTQYFMPYKEIGLVKNATKDAAVNMEFDEQKGKAIIGVYATSLVEKATVKVIGKEQTYSEEECALSPNDVYHLEVQLNGNEQPHDILVEVKDGKGKKLVSYQPQKPALEEIPKAAKPLPVPDQLKTTEELYLAGLHLEQYRHATFEPEAYYKEGLKRDAKDIRLNIAYGLLLLRRGLFAESERYFRQAVQSLTWKNTNPYDSEAYYQLGLSLKLQGRLDEAFANLYKAVWSALWQDSSYFTLAQIATERQSYEEALELIDRSLSRNVYHMKARMLKAALLRKTGQLNQALHECRQSLQLDAMDFGAYFEQVFILEEQREQEEARSLWNTIVELMRAEPRSFLYTANDYMECGLYEEAKKILARIVNFSNEPMIPYTLAYISKRTGQTEESQRWHKKAYELDVSTCFPNTLQDALVLADVLKDHPEDEKAHYYFGNLLYDKKRYDEAINHWEKARDLAPSFATPHRNLALAYYNKRHEPNLSLASLQQAFACEPSDARVFYELDQLKKKVGMYPKERLSLMNKHAELVKRRDDLYIEYVTLLNMTEQYELAIKCLLSRIFHPWEGGEGKVTGQYVYAHVEIGKMYLKKGAHSQAIDVLKKALYYPENLGEGKLHGAQENDIFYYLGCAYEGNGQGDLATQCFEAASKGIEEPASAMYYNDQPPEMIFYQGLAWKKLNNEHEANRRFHTLIDYAERHYFDDVKIDYFAVSLPDFLVFDEDLVKRNQIHCHFIRGLGLLGLSNKEAAITEFHQVLVLDPNHQGATLHLTICQEEGWHA
ncbi:tetratricopeptide repeat protein [Alkalihalobacillus hemicellulosilyticus]|uniref:TPR repeat protein n=1 Tax=Halalkalibacter hemicellulosilyticusJCM 9152 TaxID=1236971 RepID=W4Q9U0_9BACI|nr:DUF5107 domain-containing protein [Halalkalibacter hemicellulosilyticus]GAE28775.1 TPR repeat protein [Halalkalibacter hemicellulosilyticusJCM 9152]